MKLTEYNELMTKMMTMMIVLMIPSEIDLQPVDEENDDNEYGDYVKLAS